MVVAFSHMRCTCRAHCMGASTHVVVPRLLAWWPLAWLVYVHDPLSTEEACMQSEHRTAEPINRTERGRATCIRCLVHPLVCRDGGGVDDVATGGGQVLQRRLQARTGEGGRGGGGRAGCKGREGGVDHGPWARTLLASGVCAHMTRHATRRAQQRARAVPRQRPTEPTPPPHRPQTPPSRPAALAAAQ